MLFKKKAALTHKKRARNEFILISRSSSDTHTHTHKHREKREEREREGFYERSSPLVEGDQQQRLIMGKKEEDGDEVDASSVKKTLAFFSGRKSKLVLGAIGTGLAVVGCASAYSSSSSSPSSSSSSPFSLSSLSSSASSLLSHGKMLGSSTSLEG